MNDVLTITDRKAYARRVFLFLALMLLLRWWSGRYLTFISGQPLKGPDLDWSYWLVLLSGLPQFIIQHLWACKVSDGLVVFFVFAAFFFPGERRLFIALLIALFLNQITVETYSVTHSKSSVALFMALLPLCVKEEHFGLLAEFVRYFIIFILLSAAYHKLHNGALMDPEHFRSILIRQHPDLALLRPGHPTYIVSQWIIAQPFIAWMLFVSLFLCQTSFVVGIFTKNFDRILLLCLFLFVLMTYLLMRIYIWELLAGGFVFLVDYSRVKNPVSAGNPRK